MKTLTLTQPWATLMAIGAKRIETRSWHTAYRGPLSIHAAKGFPRNAIELCREEPYVSALVAAGVRTPDALPRGAIIAVVDLVDCLEISHGFQMPPEPERSFGDFSRGRCAWVMSNVVWKLLTPLPCKGRLGLWEGPAIKWSMVEAV